MFEGTGYFSQTFAANPSNLEFTYGICKIPTVITETLIM